MSLFLVHMKVADFTRWRPVFERMEATRNTGGVTNPRIYRNAADSNDLLLLFDAADAARTRQVFESVQVRDGMKEAGLIGTPEGHFIP